MENQMTAPRRIQPLKQKAKTTISAIIIIIIIIILTFGGFFLAVPSNHTLPIALAVDNSETWSVTIHVREESGISGNTIIIGKASNASDGLDQYDLPEPPFPPQYPYLRSWLQTSFAVPFNNLLQEYKASSTIHAIWNLSCVWMAASENQSTTFIQISWKSDEINATHFDSFLLYQNNTVVADLLALSSYSFPSNGTLHQFQIIGQTIEKNNTSGKNDLSILSITVFIIVLIFVAILAVFWNKHKK